mmetsp:Transcript_52646/g.160025  ORF Transcript_52646/g.160025 Transcript_52646/m.160025 type:complete len:243 (-) Transcript_52646:170-898(-)
MSLKSVPSGFSASPSLREFKISFTFPRRAPMLTNRWLPTTIGRFRSFCCFRASFSRFSRMCLGRVFKVCCNRSPKHGSHLTVVPPSSSSKPSKNFRPPSKGGHRTKHSALSLTSLTCHGTTFSGNFSLSFSLTCIQLCSDGTPLKTTTAPPTWAVAAFFFWWCCGFASNAGRGALPGRRTAAPPSLSSNLEPARAATTSSRVARMAFILLHDRTRPMSSQPSLSEAIFSWKNLSCLRLSSLR